MRKSLLKIYYKQILSSTPIISFSLFLSYIVIIPLILGFEQNFLCHFHLGFIWISLLFSFLSTDFLKNEKENGTLELYFLSSFCLPRILLIQLAGHWFIQISCLLFAFPILQSIYQFDQFAMDCLNILLGTLVLTILCGIHSSLALGIGASNLRNSLKTVTTLPTLLPLILFATSIETEWYHVLLLIGYFFLFACLFPFLISISLQD
uniref:Cytochrome c biogenesis B n=1 Tax=Pelargonium australe TaxID=59866 RepID=A0A7U3QF72_9ROSI|nr:cytochrome c biogenesis B [Pelargonium australe]